MAKNSNLTKAKKYELMDGQQRTLFHGPRAAGQNTTTRRCSVLDATGAGSEHSKGRLDIPSRPLFCRKKTPGYAGEFRKSFSGE